MTDITPERLAQIKARAEATTEGPWAYEPHGDTGEYGVGLMFGEDSEDPLFGYQDNSENIISDTVAVEVTGASNAAFIAAARQDIPDLIAALEAAQAENAKLRADLAFADTQAEKMEAFVDPLIEWKDLP